MSYEQERFSVLGEVVVLRLIFRDVSPVHVRVPLSSYSILRSSFTVPSLRPATRWFPWTYISKVETVLESVDVSVFLLINLIHNVVFALYEH